MRGGVVGRGEPTAGWSTGDEPQWRTAGELLQAGHYERLAELLQEVQVAIERRGDTIPAHVLVLARRICLACSQSQAEADWHQQACEEAVQREGKLRHQLTTLLDLVSAQESSIVAEEWDVMPQAPSAVLGPPAPDLPEPGEPLSLWQRIQAILRWRPGAQPRDSIAPELIAQDSTPPYRKNVGMPASFSVRGVARPSEYTPHGTGKPSPPPTAEIAEQATPRLVRSEPPTIPPCEEQQEVMLPRLGKDGASIPPPTEATDRPAEFLPEESSAPEPFLAEQPEQVPFPRPHVEEPVAPTPEEPEPASPSRAVEAATPTEPSGRQLPLHPSAVPDVSEKSRPSAVADEAKLGVPSLVIHCLGPFRVFQDDQPVVDWPSSKGKAIFKYLVTHRERPIPKEVLMELFWPGANPDAARNNLNVAIYGLRQALRQARPDFSHVLFQDDCYLLQPDLRIWVDVEEFQERCRIAHDLKQRGDLSAAMHEYRAAEALHQGEFLEEDRYEDWLLPLQQYLRHSFISLLDCLSEYCLDQRDYVACTSDCHKMLAVDACNEGAHRRLMRCYTRQGQRYLALRQYHLCVEALREELDVSPTSATIELCERIRQHQQI